MDKEKTLAVEARVVNILLVASLICGVFLYCSYLIFESQVTIMISDELALGIADVIANKVNETVCIGE